jgi:pimeloyl-ACP methyl ester carboxylesterase
MKLWLRRIAIGCAAFIAVVLVSGAGYEALSRRRAASRFPARGRLVDVGGRRLQLDCRGEGSPLVVFEGGMSTGGSLDWSTVHDDVAKLTRACAYSRAGILWSDPRSGAHDANAIAEDLHALLGRAGERSPRVLVGHSIGGPYALTYTEKFGSDVAGLVLVDASHPDMIQRMAAAGIHLRPPLTVLKIAASLSRTGFLRVTSGSDEVSTAYAPTSLVAMVDEIDAVDRSLDEARSLHGLGSRPLFVLTAGKPSPEFERALTPEQMTRQQEIWRALQDEEASWSTRSRHEIVPDATHRIPEDRPDRVTAAVRWVVETVRAAARGGSP